MFKPPKKTPQTSTKTQLHQDPKTEPIKSRKRNQYPTKPNTQTFPSGPPTKEQSPPQNETRPTFPARAKNRPDMIQPIFEGIRFNRALSTAQRRELALSTCPAPFVSSSIGRRRYSGVRCRKCRPCFTRSTKPCPLVARGVFGPFLCQWRGLPRPHLAGQLGP